MSADPNPAEWPQFVSHKIVRATPIVFIEEVTVDEVIEGKFRALFIEPEGHHRQFFPSEPGMLNRAQIGWMAVIYEDGWRSVSPKESFDKGHKPYNPHATKKLLMSRDNPDGWPLEDLLSLVCIELLAKTVRLNGDRTPAARGTRARNRQVVGLLTQAEALQRETLEELDTLGPDQGPRGVPRLGKRPGEN